MIISRRGLPRLERGSGINEKTYNPDPRSRRGMSVCHPEYPRSACHPELVSGPSAKKCPIKNESRWKSAIDTGLVPADWSALDSDMRQNDSPSLRSGSVLIFSLMVMGVVSLLTQQLVKSVAVGSFFSTTMVRREQAEMLALGGVNVAIAQLQKALMPKGKKLKGQAEAPVKAEGEKPKEGKENKEADNKPSQAQADVAKKFPFDSFIREIVPHLGRWQTFMLTDDHDGIDAEMSICITCEQGKIPVTAVYDEKKADLTPAAKALLKPFVIKKKLAEGALAGKLTAFFKKRRHRITDVSAFAALASEHHLPFWYDPIVSVPPGKKKQTSEQTRDIALQDLFTTWGKGSKISPLLLTDALCAVLKLRRPLGSDAHKRKGNIEEVAKKYAPSLTKGNEVVWKTVQGLWEAKPKLPKEFSSLFSPVIEPRIFSVLSCGRVAGVKQTTLAIIERVERDKKPAQEGDTKKTPPSSQQKKASKKAQRPLFKIRRMYWV